MDLIEPEQLLHPNCEILPEYFDADVTSIRPKWSDKTRRNKTPLEVACCEGQVDPIKYFLKSGVDVNRLNNVYKRGPIHFAVEAGHANVLQVLLNNKQCDPNLTSEKRTALIIAVENNSIECVRVLLDYCADPNIPNSEGLTPIHIAVRKGNREVVELILNISKFRPNLDDFHDFQDGGKLTTRQILQTKFSDIELPTAEEEEEYKMEVPKIYHSDFYTNDESIFLNKLKSIPDYQLEYADVYWMMCSATSHNFLDGIRELLRKGRRVDGFLSLESTSRIVVTHGEHRNLREMLAVDATLGNKLLLHACQELRKTDDRMDDRLECFRLIMKEPDINVQCEDHRGNTPLHYAASANSIEAINCLLKFGGSLVHRNVLGVPPMSHMSPDTLADLLDSFTLAVDASVNEKKIQKESWERFIHGHIEPPPRGIEAVIKLLERQKEEDEQELKIELDCSNFIPSVISCRQPDEAHGKNQQRGFEKNISFATTPEMEALTYIAKNPHLQPLLNHPVLSSLLYLKWDRIWPYLCGKFVFYAIFYILINVHILTSNHAIDSTSSTLSNSSNLTSTIPHTNFQQLNALGALTALCLIVLAMGEAFLLISLPARYFKYLKNIFALVLIVLGAWTLAAPNPQVGAIVILISAWEFVIYIGECPRMSASIEMLKIVTITFIRFLFLYAILILAFSFAFSMLFFDRKDDEIFHDLGHSLFKTIIMLTGELDASNIPFKSHPVLGRSIFVLFVFFIPIVMLNLLNGLAVSDIAEISKKSEIVALISRVKLINYFDELASGSGLIKFTGRFFSESAVRRSIVFKPLEFVGMRTRLFPKYLPSRKITVIIYKSKKIIVHGTGGIIAHRTSRTSPDEKTWCRACIERLVPQGLRHWLSSIVKTIHCHLLSIRVALRPCLSSIRKILPAVYRVSGRSDDGLIPRFIVDRAREVLWRRESQKRASMCAEKNIARVDAKFDTVHAKFDAMYAKCDAMNAKCDATNAKIDRLEAAICKSDRGNVGKSLLCQRTKASERGRAMRKPRARSC